MTPVHNIYYYIQRHPFLGPPVVISHSPPTEIFVYIILYSFVYKGCVHRWTMAAQIMIIYPHILYIYYYNVVCVPQQRRCRTEFIGYRVYIAHIIYQYLGITLFSALCFSSRILFII